MLKALYFDYMATTPVDARVAAKMQGYLTTEGVFGNSAAHHAYGESASQAIETARAQVASLIGAEAHEIVWTSGATEANNLALKGAAHFYQRKGKHIVTQVTEHKSVLAPCEQLRQAGFSVDYLPVNDDGSLELTRVRDALRDDTVLISIMQVNNEIGTIHDIAAIGQLAKERGILVHVDAVQSVGKMAIDVRTLPVDMMSFSAHKLYGPKGIGALYLRAGVQLQPQIVGAGHERGLRAGTLATHQIVGMGEAFAIAEQEMDLESQRLLALRERLWRGIQDIPGLLLNGSLRHRICNNINISFQHIHGEALLLALQKIAVSTAAACTTHALDPSHVLLALGRSPALANNSLRISWGRFTTEADIDEAIACLNTACGHLGAISAIQ